MEPADLFEAHHDDLRRYLVRLTGDPGVAEDASQQAFTRLVDRLPDEPENPRAWLFTVATNAARDALRTRARRGRILREEGHRVPRPRPAPDPSEAHDRRKARRRVRRALDRLSERDRTVLLMREEGFRHREIAEAVGTTTKSVGTMIARALEKLAGELDLDTGDEDDRHG